MDSVNLDLDTYNTLMGAYIGNYLKREIVDGECIFEYDEADMLKVCALYEHPAVSSIAISVTEVCSDGSYIANPEIPRNITLAYTPKTKFKQNSPITEHLRGLTHGEGNVWASEDKQVCAYSCKWSEMKLERRMIILCFRNKAKCNIVVMVADDNDNIYHIFDDATPDKDGMSDTGVAEFLIRLFAAVQYGLYNRPTVVTEKREVNTLPAKKGKNGKGKKKPKRVVSVVRHISFGEVEHKQGSHTMVCPAWGVMGHYRHYKDGKVVYIKPYTKGKMRNVLGKYEDKEYRFAKQEG